MDHVKIIQLEADRLAEVVRDTEPGTPVPTCPGWTTADLLWHLTTVHDFWARVLADDPHGDEVGEIEDHEPKRPERIDQMLPIRAEATAALVAQLISLDDDVSRWTWWPPDQTVGFTRRMQVCEATMHRVDAEIAAGILVTPIGPEPASLAVSHCVDVMWGWLPSGATYTAQTLVEFASSDTDETWLVEVGSYSGTKPDGTEYSGARAVGASEGVPQLSVTASVDQLARWAWSRQGEVRIVGDERGQAALAALIEQGIQ